MGHKTMKVNVPGTWIPISIDEEVEVLFGARGRSIMHRQRYRVQCQEYWNSLITGHGFKRSGIINHCYKYVCKISAFSQAVDMLTVELESKIQHGCCIGSRI